MVKYLKLLTLLTVWLFSSLYAQDVILSDEFDDGDGQWAGGWIDASTAVVTVSIDTNSVLSGKNSYLLDVTTGGPDTWRIQRNANCPLLAGKMYTVSFEAVADKDMTINIMMEIVGDPYTKRLVEWPEVTTTPQTFTYTLIATEDVSNNQFKMFFGGPDNNNYKIWVDNIVVTEEDDLGPVSQWGLVQEYKSLWPILNDATTPAGNGSMGGDVVSGWKGLQGGFSQDLTISAENAVVVTGQVEFVGANAGTAYTPIRYAITYQDSSDLLYAATDSAQWSRSGHHSGYGFHPRTGAGTMSNGNGGAGTVWTISDGNWASTWSNNGGPASAALQAPRNAELIEGTYNFAISVHAIDDTTNEVRWYMIEENNKYWFGGVTKAAATTKTFNSVEFGVNEVEYTQFNVVGMRAELGAPIDVPEAPWQSYYVDQWGLVKEYSSLWPMLNDSTTLVGDGSMGGDVVSGWKGLQGGLGQPVEFSTEKAVIVEGQIEFVGANAGTAYTPIRYAFTYQDSSSLMYQYTDSAQWSGTGHHYGYGFHPRTGAGTMSNGNGGAGTVWTINNGNWASTWSNNGGPVSAALQAPRNAELIEGTYDFAISVHAVNDTTNEVRWYMIEEDNKYWFGGTIMAPATTKKFNSILFGVNEVEYTQFNVIAMKVDKGDPIDVPEAPWQSYYVDQWGLAKEYSSLWPMLNDSTTLVGDGSMGGDVVSGWKGLQGGLGQPVEFSTEKAVIVEGQIEFVGANAGTAYTPIRYAFTYQDSSSLMYQYTDSAQWSGTGHHYGYGFHPRTGAGTMSNGNGGAGTVWTINNGNWASTWSNNGGPVSAALQAPRNAELIEGTYDFAISVHSVNDTTNEVRWYMIEEDNKYWFGGTIMAPATTKKFNSILFGVNEVEYTQFNVIAMKVDKGAPIDVPEAPWQSYYVDQWGLAKEYSSLWPMLNDSTTLVGDGSMGGDVVSGWKGLQGGLGQPVEFSTEKAIIVEGQIELVGANAGTAYTPLRYAFTYQDSSSLMYQYTDSAQWSGTGHHYGYGFHPRTGAGTMSNGNGGAGTVWTINNGNWASTWSNNGGPVSAAVQAPRNAELIEGTYDFAISVHAVNDTTNEVRWYMIEEDTKYWFGGIIKAPATTKKFNSILFGVNEVEYTQFNVIAMKVDKGDPIDVPKAPWQDFYVDTWGIYGGNNGGWNLVPGEFTGNVDLAGTAAPSGWAVVRGDLGTVNLEADVDMLLVEGKIVLEGGGFEGPASLRFGVFQGGAAGNLDSTETGYNWNGAGDADTGYLMLAQEGSNGAEAWGTGSGTWGQVANDVWNNFAGGTALQSNPPSATTGGAGEYEFQINVAPLSDGTSDVRWILKKGDGSYYMEGRVLDSAPLTSFNSLVVGVGDGATATSLLLRDVEVSMTDELIPTSVTGSNSTIPDHFSLEQNYPNPFNPTTTIEYALPENSEVTLKIYDVTGRVVTELIKGQQNAGYHKVVFDASHLATGVYFFKLEANDFTNVKKLMLIK